MLGVSSQDKENVSSAHLMKMGVLVAAMPERTYDPVGDDDCLKVDNFMSFLNSVIIWVRFPRTGILAKMWSFFFKSRAFV